MKLAAEKYIKNLLLKGTQGETEDDTAFKVIQNEQDLKTAFCSLYNQNNDSDSSIERREQKLLGEFRKINMKLIKLDKRLDGMEKSLTEAMNLQMTSMKNEIIRTVRNIIKENK